MIHSRTRTFNADTYTPVQLYLLLRHHFRNCCLLESNDYHSRQDSRSFIGFDPLVSIELKNEQFELKTANGTELIPVDASTSLTDQTQALLSKYTFEHQEHNGFFGRMSFEFTHADETHLGTQSKPSKSRTVEQSNLTNPSISTGSMSGINSSKPSKNRTVEQSNLTNPSISTSSMSGINSSKPSKSRTVEQSNLTNPTISTSSMSRNSSSKPSKSRPVEQSNLSSPPTPSDIPLLHLFLFRHVIVIDHFTNEGILLENSFSTEFQETSIETLMRLPAPSVLPFELVGTESAAHSDDEFSNLVERGIQHCQRGDVFQLVLSNRFQQSYFGDDFHVYRQLRRTNPSPYLFYFDFESYRLFGSSPEAQTVVQNGKVEIHPIAGTVPKTGVDSVDAQQLEFLKNDEKENAEHTMLVDLARNDLSRNCTNVQIEAYKEIQHFSHVIHLVSKVTGECTSNDTFKTISQAFPAGTLSGTPKPRALELIHEYEQQPRGFYGGAVGILQPNGDANMAIVIRSILSKENTLQYQAGAGIVLDSEPERETQEVHHKLRAVREAIRKANSFQSETEKKTHS